MSGSSRTRISARLAVLLASLLFASSCSASTEITALDGEPSTATVSTSEETATELSSELVYQAIENSVVYVQSPDGLSSGSGIVIEDGWVLTNAHVVDRHQAVRIGRSDGDDLGLHDVYAVDWIFDLALVGPLTDTTVRPIERGDSGALSLGSRVLLAGFPDEDSVDPTPTLTQGIVSRRRSIALGDYPFLQVDATIAPGQSGGALVNGLGQLVGISGLEFGEGEFGLVFASDAMWPRIEQLIALGGPALPSGEGAFNLTDQVGPLRNFGFTVEVGESGSLDFVVSSPDDVWVDLQTLGGITVTQGEDSVDPFRVSGSGESQFYVDELAAGGEDVIATLEPGMYQVVIGTFGTQVSEVEISSANTLRRFIDVEEGRELPTNEIVEGEFDWVRDTDQWELPLAAGEQVSIVADGIADTLLVVRLDDVVIATSDDEGLGLFGTGAQLDFTAETGGTYIVEVGTFDQTRWGYLIEATVTTP